MHLVVTIGILFAGETAFPGTNDVFAVVVSHAYFALPQVLRYSVRLSIDKCLVVGNELNLVVSNGNDVELLQEFDVVVRQSHRLCQYGAVDIVKSFAVVHPHVQVADGCDRQAVIELRIRHVSQHLLGVCHHRLTVDLGHHPFAFDLLGNDRIRCRDHGVIDFGNT